MRPMLLYINKMLKEVFTCHPERSEGSHVFDKERFFASLRMTIKVKRFITHYTRRVLKNPDCRLLKKPQRRGARKIDEQAHLLVRWSEAMERNEAYEVFSEAC